MPGQSAAASGTSTARATRASRASRPTSASTAADRRLQDRHRRRRTTGIDIYRLGYYGGDGARKVATDHAVGHAAADQPHCLTDDARPAWSTAATGRVSASWAVPATAVSGIYFAKLVRPTPAARATSSSSCATTRHTPTCCSRRPTRPGRPTTSYGGNSLYIGGRRPGAPTRSATTGRSPRARHDGAEDWVFNAEYPMVRWLEANGYDVSYTTGVDTDRRGAELHRAQGLPVGRPRRVLVRRRSARTSRRRATPA